MKFFTLCLLSVVFLQLASLVKAQVISVQPNPLPTISFVSTTPAATPKIINITLGPTITYPPIHVTPMISPPFITIYPVWPTSPVYPVLSVTPPVYQIIDDPPYLLTDKVHDGNTLHKYKAFIRAADENFSDNLTMSVYNLPFLLSQGECRTSVENLIKIISCEISGIPLLPGDYSFTVHVSDGHIGFLRSLPITIK